MFESIAFVLVLGAGCLYEAPEPVTTKPVEKKEETCDGCVTFSDATTYASYMSGSSDGCNVRMFKDMGAVESYLEQRELKSYWRLLEVRRPFGVLDVIQEKKADYKVEIAE